MIKFELTKYFLLGNLAGQIVKDSGSFLSNDAAEKWAARVSEKPSVPYVVTQVRNTETDELFQIMRIL